MQIPLTNGGFTEIDDADESLARAFRWRRMEDKRKSGRSEYAVTWVNKKPLFLHRLIMKATPEQQVDHRDEDGLNNRRDNLRFGTQSQNLANRTHSNRAKSGFRGVYGTKSGKWVAAIATAESWHSIRRLGTFISKEEAARAYDTAALERWGEFAKLNFPQQNVIVTA